MTPPARGIRRHSVLMSDAEVVVVERALRCYATVISIQTSSTPQHEADLNARISSVVQGHMKTCTCPVPPEPQGGS